MPRATILVIGSEILSGATLDINSQFLSQRLPESGFEVIRHLAVPDSSSGICRALEHIFEDSDLVLITGGLGPTFDDTTKEVLAGFFQRKLVFNPAQYARIKNHFKRRKRRLHATARQQAFLPEGCRAFSNNFGVACGIGVERNGKWAIALPGVPDEMRGMYDQEVGPFLRRQFKEGLVSKTLSVKVLGRTEVEVLERLGREFPPADPGVECGIYPHCGEVVLKMYFRDVNGNRIDRKMSQWKKFMTRKLGADVVGFEDVPFEQTVGALLRSKKGTLSVAESLTGGLIMRRLTDIPGASRFLRGGMVTYSDSAKQRLLGVRREVLLRRTAVSAQVAKAMAENVKSRLGTSFGLSATGNAGPGRNGNPHPVGTVFIAVASKRGTSVRRYRFHGTRDRIRWLASQNALALLREAILNG